MNYIKHEKFNDIFCAALQGILCNAATDKGSVMALGEDSKLGCKMRTEIVKAALRTTEEAVKQIDELTPEPENYSSAEATREWNQMVQENIARDLGLIDND